MFVRLASPVEERHCDWWHGIGYLLLELLRWRRSSGLRHMLSGKQVRNVVGLAKTYSRRVDIFAVMDDSREYMYYTSSSLFRHGIAKVIQS